MSVLSSGEFGALLRERRERAGLSRDKLARLCRLSEALIKYLETGRRRTVSTGSAHRLIGVPALGLTLQDFAGVRVGREKTSKPAFDYLAALRSRRPAIVI